MLLAMSPLGYVHDICYNNDMHTVATSYMLCLVFAVLSAFSVCTCFWNPGAYSVLHPRGCPVFSFPRYTGFDEHHQKQGDYCENGV